MLPKVELHCHLDGIIDPAMLRAIRVEDPDYPLSVEELEAAYPVDDFASFIRWHEVSAAMEGDLDRFRPVLALHLERLKEQGVVYTELMVGGSEIPRDPGEALEKLTAFREWLDEQAGGVLQVELLHCFSRTRSPAQLASLIDRNLRLHEAGLLAGVALAGPEAGFPVRPFQRLFARYRDAGVPIEIHAGEWCGPESVWDAVEYGCPDRIGHGVALFQDPRLVELFQERQLHVEICPTSNLKTGSVARLEEHPVSQARDLGIPFSISTDDPGPFENSMASEYGLLERLFGFDEEDFRCIYTHSLAARFQSRLRVPDGNGTTRFAGDTEAQRRN
jgi:adenosine deaminase